MDQTHTKASLEKEQPRREKDGNIQLRSISTNPRQRARCRQLTVNFQEEKNAQNITVKSRQMFVIHYLE